MWIRLPHFKSKWQEGPSLKSKEHKNVLLLKCWNHIKARTYTRLLFWWKCARHFLKIHFGHSQNISMYSFLFCFFLQQTDKDLILLVKTTMWRLTCFLKVIVVLLLVSDTILPPDRMNLNTAAEKLWTADYWKQLKAFYGSTSSSCTVDESLV